MSSNYSTHRIYQKKILKLVENQNISLPLRPLRLCSVFFAVFIADFSVCQSKNFDAKLRAPSTESRRSSRWWLRRCNAKSQQESISVRINVCQTRLYYAFFRPIFFASVAVCVFFPKQKFVKKHVFICNDIKSIFLHLCVRWHWK